MAIVPTSLLQFADGATSQGFSTLYDLKLLNTFADDSAVGGVVDADGTKKDYTLTAKKEFLAGHTTVIPFMGKELQYTFTVSPETLPMMLATEVLI